jgi:flagellar protein FlbT
MKTMQISLRAGQRFYLNGAVIRADRKVTLELLNNANFLLDSHVLQENETTTPLRQLYFVAQTMLIDPSAATKTKQLFASMAATIQSTFSSSVVKDGLKEAAAMIEDGRIFEALKALRQLFPAEAAILATGTAPAAAA